MPEPMLERIRAIRSAAELKKTYLCSAGPKHCPKCEISCAYGRRYLQIVSEKGENTIMSYTAKDRAQQAADLIRAGKTDGEAAREVGYKNPNSMQACIREYLKISPAKIREEAKSSQAGIAEQKGDVPDSAPERLDTDPTQGNAPTMDPEEAARSCSEIADGPRKATEAEEAARNEKPESELKNVDIVSDGAIHIRGGKISGANPYAEAERVHVQQRPAHRIDAYACFAEALQRMPRAADAAKEANPSKPNVHTYAQPDPMRGFRLRAIEGAYAIYTGLNVGRMDIAFMCPDLTTGHLALTLDSSLYALLAEIGNAAAIFMGRAPKNENEESENENEERREAADP